MPAANWNESAGDLTLCGTLNTCNLTATAAIAGATVAATGAITGASMALTGPLTRSNATLAALGTNQATAAVIATDVVMVTGADGTKGVVLPTAVAGRVLTVINVTAATLNVYPATGAAIDGGSANAGVTLLTTERALFVAKDATNWYSLVGVAA